MVFPVSESAGLTWNDCAYEGGDHVFRGLIRSPIGDIRCTYCSKGIHSISRVDRFDDSKFTAKEDQDVIIASNSAATSAEPVEAVDATAVIVNCASWLATYFSKNASAENLKKTPLTLCMKENETSFHQTCHIILPTLVPFGKTISYSQLAKAAGNEIAGRAAGAAMRRNRFIIVVPCHRVTHKAGKKVKYSAGGKEVKLWLLEHEKKAAEKLPNLS